METEGIDASCRATRLAGGPGGQAGAIQTSAAVDVDVGRANYKLEEDDEEDEDEATESSAVAEREGESRPKQRRELQVGDRVEAQFGWRDDELWWPATITQVGSILCSRA